MSAQPAYETFRVPKATFLAGLGYECHAQEVVDFHESLARIRIPTAPARTSKSYAGAYDFLWHLIPDFAQVKGKILPCPPDPGRPIKVGWIVAPSYQLAKEFDYLWLEIVQRRCFEPLGGQVVQKSNNLKQGHMSIKIAWGRGTEGDDIFTQVDVKSATNPESCQAEEVDVCLMSEAAEQDEKMWHRYLATRVRNFIAPTTPKLTAEWLYKMIEDAKLEQNVGVASFRFTPHCNPMYDWDRYWQEHLKAESRVVGSIETEPGGHECFAEDSQCEAMKDPWFGEQFGGRWTFEADRVLPFRWVGDHSHVLDEVPPWVPYGKLYVSTDYGYTDPGVALWWSVGADGQVCLYRELYESKMDPMAFVRRIKEISDENDERISAYLADPQKPEVKDFMRQIGLPMYSPKPKAMRDRKSGHMRVVDALTPSIDTGIPKLHVLSEKAGEGMGCPKTIHEWKVLRRKAGFVQDEWSTSSLVGRDDAYDCARYFFAANPHGANVDDWTASNQFDSWLEDANRASRYDSANRPFNVVMGAA